MEERTGLTKAADTSGKILVVAAAVLVLVLFLWAVRAVVIPVFLALLVATQLHPFVEWLRRRRVPSALAVAVAALGAFMVTLVLIVGIVGQFVGQIGELGDQTRAGARNVVGWVATHSGPLDWSRADVNQAISDLSDRVNESSGPILNGVLGGVSVVATATAGFLLAFVFLIYMLIDRGRSFVWFRDRFRDRKRAEVVERLGLAAWKALGGYVRGVVMVAIFDAVLIGAALFIVGVPLAAALTATVFVLAFVPILGAWVAGIITTLVALAGVGVDAAIIVAVVSLVVQQLDGMVVTPLVYRQAVELNPMVTLGVVTAGGILGGVVGAFIAVPVTASLWAVNEEHRRMEAESDDHDTTRTGDVAPAANPGA